MSSIGPFSLQLALLGLALLLAWAVAKGLAQRRAAGPGGSAGKLLMDAGMWGFVTARIAYVAWWWPEYRVAPASLLAIADGGFVWWVGVPAAAAWVLWRTRGAQRRLRWPVLAGIGAGLLAWVLVGYWGQALRASAPPLPELVLEQQDGTPVNLQDFQGQPVVLNLWATWCPPCRREMPVFAEAQQRWPQVRFLMVNQGDERIVVADYLDRYHLHLTDVLRDPGSLTMQATGARVLPTTLFFDPDGRLVDSHVGELTRAGLADRLQRRLGVATSGLPADD